MKEHHQGHWDIILKSVEVGVIVQKIRSVGKVEEDCIRMCEAFY